MSGLDGLARLAGQGTSKPGQKARGGNQISYADAEKKINFFRRIRTLCLAAGRPWVYEVTIFDWWGIEAGIE